MNFSVIIPTRNRKRLLLKLLTSVNRSDFSGILDVIVINNNSQDETSAMLKNFTFSRPYWTLQVFNENRVGPSFCRNVGIREAKWPHIIFIDDDCMVPPGFFEKYKKLWRAHPHARIIGGKVIPVKSQGQFTPKEQKFLKEYYGVFAATTLGDTARALTLGELIYSANMSIWLPKNQISICFDERLGREIAPRTVLFAEDYELCGRLMLMGEYVYYSPDVIVYNSIDILRFSHKHMAKRQALSGFEQALMEKILEEKFGKAYDKATWSYIYVTAIIGIFRGHHVLWAVSLFNTTLKLIPIVSYLLCKLFIFR